MDNKIEISALEWMKQMYALDRIHGTDVKFAEDANSKKQMMMHNKDLNYFFC